jgi:hypothetical protein
MNQNKKRKKIYIPPQFEVIEIALESFLNVDAFCIFPINTDENKHLLQNLKVIT